jgi:hypothetical protein
LDARPGEPGRAGRQEQVPGQARELARVTPRGIALGREDLDLAYQIVQVRANSRDLTRRARQVRIHRGPHPRELGGLIGEPLGRAPPTSALTLGRSA